MIRKHFQKVPCLLLSVVLVLTTLLCTACTVPEEYAQTPSITVATEIPAETKAQIDENGVYSDKDSVALYIHVYGHLPENFITKSDASKLGWQDKGTLDELCPGKSIGGDVFSNREGLLPKEEGRKYYECDIDYVKGKRNAKRIVYSNDGLIYYTEDHYQSFDLLYGEE